MTSQAVEKLVFAILLSAIKKRAEVIDLKCGRDRFVIDFIIDGARCEEMRPPLELQTPIFEQLQLMASDAGVIELVVGDDRHHLFAIVFSTQGALQRCEIRPR